MGSKGLNNMKVNRNKAGVILLWVAPMLFLLFFYFYPLGSIFSLVVTKIKIEGFQSIEWFRLWEPISFTFWQAILSTLATLIIGLPSAYVFARFDFHGKRLIRILSTIPFILPTIVAVSYTHLRAHET